MLKVKCPKCGKMLTTSTGGIITCPCGKKLKVNQSSKASSPSPTPSPTNLFSDADFDDLDIPSPSPLSPNPAATPKKSSMFKKKDQNKSNAMQYLNNARQAQRESASRDSSEYWWLQMYIKLNRGIGIFFAVVMTLALAGFASIAMFGSINGALNGQFAASAVVMSWGAVILVIYGFILFFYLTIWFALGEFVAAILELTLNSRRL